MMAPVSIPTDSTGIRAGRKGPVTTIVLDRAERHNALEAADVTALKDVLDGIASDGDTRVVVVTGAGDQTFSSGASLDQMESGEMNGAVFDTLTSRLASFPLPTIARINGSVYGGGVELGLCCDFRIGVRGSRLSVPAARLGICYPPGGLRRYVSRLGLGPASRILLSSEEMDADEMLRVGYLTHLVDAFDLDGAVDALAGRLARLAPLAVRNMKRILLEVADGSSDAEALDALAAECVGSEDREEGLRAWREGRAPRFEGR